MDANWAAVKNMPSKYCKAIQAAKKAYNIRHISETANHQAELFRVFRNLTGAR